MDETTFDSILTGIPIPFVKPPFQYTSPGQQPEFQIPQPYQATPPSQWPSPPYSTSTTPPLIGPTPIQPQSLFPIFPNGTLIKGSGPDIYLIENGVRHLMPDMGTFDAMGLNLGNVINIDDQKLGSIPFGVPFPNKERIKPK